MKETTQTIYFLSGINAGSVFVGFASSITCLESFNPIGCDLSDELGGDD